MSGRRVVEHRVLHRGHGELVVDVLEGGDGGQTPYAYVAPPRFVAVLALDADRRAMLVRQWRHPIGTELREIPAGGVDEGEDDQGAVRRELAEECAVEPGELHDLGELVSSPGTSAERGRLFLATDCRPLADPPGGEPVELERLELAALRAEVAAGTLADAKTAVALARAQLRGLLGG